MEGRSPVGLRLYVATVVLSAVALVTAFAFSSGTGWPNPRVGPIELLLAGCFFTLVALWGEISPVEIPSTTRMLDTHGDEIALSSTAYIASLLLYGPAFAVAVGIVSALSSQILRRKSPLKIAFNVSQYVLTIGLSGVFLLGTGTDPRSFEAYIGSAGGAVSLLALFAAYFLLNTGLVALVLAIAKSASFVDVWKMGNREVFLPYIGMLNVGLVAAILWTFNPFAEVLLFLPLIVLKIALKMTSQLKQETTRSLIAIADMVDSRDSYAYHHSMEVARYSTLIATKMRLPLEDVEMINFAALLHDIGKIGTPDRVLHKAAGLDGEESAIMRRHPSEGANVLQHFTLFRDGMDLVLYHQEHHDGSGYPKGLAGKQIPIGARIIHVADAYQAMTSDRVYRKALPSAEAVRRLVADSGKQFDPEVVKSMLEVLHDSGANVETEIVDSGASKAGAPGEQQYLLGVGGPGRTDPGAGHP